MKGERNGIHTGYQPADRDRAGAQDPDRSRKAFTLDINPPTVTAQEHRIRIVRGRPMFYDITVATLNDT